MSMIVIVPIPHHVRIIAVLIGSGEGLQSLGSFVIAATALSRRAARALLGLAQARLLVLWRTAPLFAELSLTSRGSLARQGDGHSRRVF